MRSQVGTCLLFGRLGLFRLRIRGYELEFFKEAVLVIALRGVREKHHHMLV